VTRAGEPVKLTAQEYKLLSYLLHHKGKVVSRTELIEHIYDQDFDRDSNTIEVFVTRIRKKLGAGRDHDDPRARLQPRRSPTPDRRPRLSTPVGRRTRTERTGGGRASP
jgi:hypothetical protein